MLTDNTRGSVEGDVAVVAELPRDDFLPSKLNQSKLNLSLNGLIAELDACVLDMTTSPSWSVTVFNIDSIGSIVL